MSIRTRLLTLFAALAVIPLLAIGWVDYARSLRAVEEVVASQTDVIARQAADAAADNFSMVRANLSLLAGNTTVTGILHAGRPSVVPTGIETAYLRQLRSATLRYFTRVVYRNPAGDPILPQWDEESEPENIGSTNVERTYVISAPIMVDGVVRGSVEAAMRLDSLLPRNLIDAKFGRSGWTALMDSLLNNALLAGNPGATAKFIALNRDDEILARGIARDAAQTRFTVGDSTYVASTIAVVASPFVVMSAGNVREFAEPFANIRASNLTAVLATTALASLLFMLFLWRATRSLAALTEAADHVGRGRLDPPLPPGGRDEVGRLSVAFAHMISRVRDTLAEKERSRRMAAVGEFASLISHEIRNPLTSIKLTLQTVDRAAKAGAVPAHLQPPVSMSLGEIDRLDRVVRGVLQLGRGGPGHASLFQMHDAAASAVESIRPTLESCAVQISLEDRSDGSHVLADRSLVDAAAINLFINAIEAMPGGGSIRVTIENATRAEASVVRLRVEDTGSGISAADRERVFTPFYSTKPEGSGIGLALAYRTVEDHAGRLWNEARPDGKSGAVFVLELPTAPSPQ